MNATLQCLSQTEDLTNYFLDEERSSEKIKNNNIAIKNRNALQLTPVYLELVKQLWDKNSVRKYIEPKRFMKTVEEMNPLFKLGQAGDSKDFIIFLLEQFHTELKKSLINDNNQEETQMINQYDKNEAFNNFFDDFKKQISIISDIFFGVIETTNICLYCKNDYTNKRMPYPICYNYQIFNCLIFPLEEVKKYKNDLMKRNGVNIIQNNSVTLEECFYYNQKTDYFTGDNRNYCNICKQTYDSHYTSKIYSSPNVLVLILNRNIITRRHGRTGKTIVVDNFTEKKNICYEKELFGFSYKSPNNEKSQSYIEYTKVDKTFNYPEYTVHPLCLDAIKIITANSVEIYIMCIPEIE